MKFAKHLSMKKTPQSAPIPGSGQVPNSAGGYAWTLDPWAQLDRFLILGTEGGTYYIGERKLTLASAKNALKLIHEDGPRFVSRVAQISTAGRAPKNDPAIFALALAAANGNTETKALAFEALPEVCRTGTHLFQFAEEVGELRGWGRGLRRAIQNWYNLTPAEDLAYQAIKYRQRGGWTHRDLLRLAHPRPATPEHKALYKWIVDGELIEPDARLEAFEKLQASKDAKEAAQLIREHRLPRECVPTELLVHAAVWEALLEDMPLGALVRNLANMTRCGLLSPKSDATQKVLASLGDQGRIQKARLHPIALLLAHATYGAGHGLRGKNEWKPVPRIVDALDSAFYLAFQSIQPANKRFLLGVDVSGSMTWSTVAGTPLSACEAATAMAMVTLATEPACTPMAFADNFRRLNITPRTLLKDALKQTRNVNFGGTDCALPMLYATKNKLEVDAFVVYTDNETWFGNVHPKQALAEYRQKSGIGAKLIVVGMCANSFTIADPRDSGMLDVVGFDAAVPAAMREFVVA